MVSNVSGDSDVRMVEWAGPNYAQDVRGFNPVAPSLLADLAARPAAARLRGVRPVSPALPVAGPVAQPAPVAGPPAPSPVPAPPAPPPAPSLTLTMSTDKQEVHPNEVVTYSIRVSNGGPGLADGVVVESHVPDGATLAGYECDGAFVAAKGDEGFTCGPVASASSHALLFGIASLPAGSDVVLRFSVRVDRGLHHNTAITNHAHAFAANADLVDSEQATVIV